MKNAIEDRWVQGKGAMKNSLFWGWLRWRTEIFRRMCPCRTERCRCWRDPTCRIGRWTLPIGSPELHLSKYANINSNAFVIEHVHTFTWYMCRYRINVFSPFACTLMDEKNEWVEVSSRHNEEPIFLRSSFFELNGNCRIQYQITNHISAPVSAKKKRVNPGNLTTKDLAVPQTWCSRYLGIGYLLGYAEGLGAIDRIIDYKISRRIYRDNRCRVYL